MQVVAVTYPLQLGFARQAMIGIKVTGDVQEVAAKLGIDAVSETPEQFKRFIAADVAQSAELLKSAGVDVVDDESIPGARRCYVADPHGIALDMQRDLMVIAHHGHRERSLPQPARASARTDAFIAFRSGSARAGSGGLRWSRCSSRRFAGCGSGARIWITRSKRSVSSRRGL